MKLSHIICSRNRATRLAVTLSKIDPQSLARHNVDLVFVDSASDDSGATLAVMKAFATQTPTPVCVLRAERAGLSTARNVGLRAASGELITFTDDDCYLDDNYYDALLRDFDALQCQYGMGQILLFDPSDDNRVAFCALSNKDTIQPRTLLPGGMIQGANMFFLRRIFEEVGNFSEDLGAGTPFPCEDIEFATRASFAGFTGALLPSVIVYHHHERKPGSLESDATLRGYDTGRGAYYAIALTRGLNECWQLWSRQSQSNGPMSKALAAKLEREFRGAADYLKVHLSTN